MRRAFCDKEFQKRKEWRTCVTTDPQTQNATASVVNDRSYATACHSMLARSCWLGDSTRICDAQAAPPRICDAQAAPPTLPSVAALASAASFPFPGHPTNPGSAEENDGMQACKEGSRPGEEGLISRSEIKARSPPQAAPSNSAARGGRQSQFQFSGYKPGL